MSDYDYTRHDGNDTPFGDSNEVDNFEIADNAAPAQTAEDITRENVYSDVPPGEHVLQVFGFSGAPKYDYYKVDVNGVMMSYEAASIRVRYCLPHAPKTTIEDYFVLPPSDPNQMIAYTDGVPPGKKMKGFNAKKFYQFIGSLGWPYPAGGNLPPDARKLGNWKGRQIRAVAQLGTPYEEKVNGVPTGNMKQGRPQVKLFSYAPAGATAEALRPAAASYGSPQAARPNGQGQGPAQAQSRPQADRPQRAMATAAIPGDDGLDDL
jgi:hypothetical protein